MDTGLDNDHPDIFGRVVTINTQYGLDPSPIDSNSGYVRTSLSQFWAMVVLMHQRQALPQRQTL